MLNTWSQWGLLRLHPTKTAVAQAETGISMCAGSGCLIVQFRTINFVL